MNPIVAGLRVLLPDKLVKLAMGLDPVEPLFAFLDVAVDAEICGLALQVLRVTDTTHRFVECRASEATTYLDGFLHGNPERFQDICSEINEVYHLLHVGFITYSFCFGCF